jgi:glycine/D-amino acid oxidase-like deaminating enzyme
MYKLAVVGRGLIGSAAARHLTEQCDGVVAIEAVRAAAKNVQFTPPSA